jgi:hypothetical protein
LVGRDGGLRDIAASDVGSVNKGVNQALIYASSLCQREGMRKQRQILGKDERTLRNCHHYFQRYFRSLL